MTQFPSPLAGYNMQRATPRPALRATFPSKLGKEVDAGGEEVIQTGIEN